ncbi:glycosyltransferase family 2 protein [Paraburkholderia silvatlantica]|uniref:glycosyltransferase family 2 protein n=1 Tax=Paraburkholderia silvatlantica TaxID=321895 RepID=UPI00105F8345|nr:glycosyltransferase family 2 protein [Paraburkholderia silvatlantica]TDQ92458.1 GT2 family glycosyltransferase [Paraburkholderia silvatlantica]
MRTASLARLPQKSLRALHHAITVRGGVLPALRAGWATFRREGAAGLVRRAVRDDVGAYRTWIEQFDTLDEANREALGMALSALRRQPVISVIVPVFNTPEPLLRAMIESVRAQIYPHWELCIVDDASTQPHVMAIVREYAQEDARVRFTRRDVNGHICAASNDALGMATGAFVALLDHDDVLREHALGMAAIYLNRFPSARMLYSDEDKLAPNGARVEPYFKPDWNPMLMLGQNMFSHLGVFETDLVREVGGFRVGFEGSQDHDLALRCAERAGDDAVIHVPHVLYHWRVTAQSTSSSVSAKPYARDASLRAVREHLARGGFDAEVRPLSQDSTMLRVTFAVPEPAPLVSIIIPTRDGADLLQRCIESVKTRTCYPNYEIIIVDNGSNEPRAVELLAGYSRMPGIQVLRIDAQFNYSALNNEAVAVARGSVLCLLNNDIEVISTDWLDTLVGYASLPTSGAVGAALWYPDDHLQHGGVLLGIGDLAGHYHHKLRRGARGYFGRAVLAQQVSAVSAACLIVRKALFEEVGGLDAEHLSVAFNDVDLCLKLEAAGYRNIYVPYAELYHHESATRGSDTSPSNAARFAKEAAWMRNRWGQQVREDRFYNPNLALGGAAVFSLAFPPRVAQCD